MSPGQVPRVDRDACYHCGEDVPAGTDFGLTIDGDYRAMCCPGCRAVASLIDRSGMAGFYRQRTAYSERPATEGGLDSSAWAIYDQPDLADSFSQQDEAGYRDARLLLGGITCAACTWLIERSLSAVEGVERALVNLAQSRLDIRFDPRRVALSDIFARIDALGYRPQPLQHATQRALFESERKTALRRVAVAGIGMMQVGMFGIALHAGDLQGISPEYQGLLRWVSCMVATFVVWYSARPFFSTAWRHLRQGTLVMDLPVSLAIGLAWLASVWATVSGQGQVYFDSVVMFTFFLLLGRFLEQRVRQRHALNWFDLETTLPAAVSVFREGTWQLEARQQLRPGDRILLRPGDTVPLDARVAKGRSALQEASFNGEQMPRAVQPGDTVYAGTVNTGDSLEAEVLCLYEETRLAALQRSVDYAQSEKPRLAQLADRIASWFVAGVLLITLLTAAGWYLLDPARALWVSLAVLVVSCPCALALATPAALTSAASWLRSNGVIVRGENALEALAATDHMIFDKTGTLTEGQLQLEQVALLADCTEADALSLAAALQQHANHPVATAFRGVKPADGFDQGSYLTGAGVSGRRGGREYRIGSAAFCREKAPALPPAPDASRYWVALCTEEQPLAWIGLGDRLRPEAPAVISRLAQAGLELELLTGDHSGQGERLAHSLGLSHWQSGLSPQQKMARVTALQQAGVSVTMVGDGLNDAPVLKLANSSFAVAGATDLARTQADFVIAGGDLWAIPRTLEQARRCRRIIKQNFGWALGYNLCGIPLAAMGLVPPWAAAIGMSLSSLLVVLNSLRLNRRAARRRRLT